MSQIAVVLSVNQPNTAYAATTPHPTLKPNANDATAESSTSVYVVAWGCLTIGQPMGELAVWLFVGWLVAGFFYYAWPVLILIAAVALAAWIFKTMIQAVEDGLDKHRQEQSNLIKRADTQHAQIMAGDDVAGTYGIYQPPPGLR